MTEMTQEALKLPPDQHEQVEEILRLWQSARDALNDEMIGRLASTLGQGLDTLDRFNRSGIADALPAIGEFVRNGDLQRVMSLARLIAAAEDSLSDDMVARIAVTVSESLSALDRLTRSGVLEQILKILSQPGVLDAMLRIGSALAKTNAEFDSLPRAKGGLGSLLKFATDSENQDAMQFIGLMGKHLRGTAS